MVYLARAASSTGLGSGSATGVAETMVAKKAVAMAKEVKRIVEGWGKGSVRLNCLAFRDSRVVSER